MHVTGSGDRAWSIGFQDWGVVTVEDGHLAVLVEALIGNVDTDTRRAEVAATTTDPASELELLTGWQPDDERISAQDGGAARPHDRESGAVLVQEHAPVGYIQDPGDLSVHAARRLYRAAMDEETQVVTPDTLRVNSAAA